MNISKTTYYSSTSQYASTILLNELHNDGYKWSGGDILYDNTSWDIYDTCTYYKILYQHKLVLYGNTDELITDNGIEIINLSRREIALSIIHYEWLSKYVQKTNIFNTDNNLFLRIQAVLKSKRYSVIDQILFNRILKQIQSKKEYTL